MIHPGRATSADREHIMKTDFIRPPEPSESAPFYHRYINLVPTDDLMGELRDQTGRLESLFRDLDDAESEVLHAPYTWTLKQVLGHLVDCERTFGERLHRFAVGDTQPMPGIDENRYVAEMDYDTPTARSLVQEWCLSRQANVLLVERLTPEQWDCVGVASDSRFTVRAIVYILAGHYLHHEKIIRGRLGLSETT